MEYIQGKGMTCEQISIWWTWMRRKRTSNYIRLIYIYVIIYRNPNFDAAVANLS